MLVGIDPGKTGAIATLHGDGNVTLIKNPPTSRELLDYLEGVADEGCALGVPVGAVVERVGNFHPSGNSKQDFSRISGNLKSREQQGEIRMAMVAAGITLHKEVMPRSWMTKVAPGYPRGNSSGQTQARKNFIWQKVQLLYPAVKVHKYAADALGILHYGQLMGW